MWPKRCQFVAHEVPAGAALLIALIAAAPRVSWLPTPSSGLCFLPLALSFKWAGGMGAEQPTEPSNVIVGGPIQPPATPNLESFVLNDQSLCMLLSN